MQMVNLISIDCQKVGLKVSLIANKLQCISCQLLIGVHCVASTLAEEFMFLLKFLLSVLSTVFA